MRIAVFSTPRTCSTFVCEILANRFNLYNHNEDVFTHVSHTNENEKIEKQLLLEHKNNYVIKLFAKYFYNDMYINTRAFNWNIFDYIILTERDNITNQMASLYNILYENVEKEMDLSNEITVNWLNAQREYTQLFYNMKRQLLNTYNNVFVLTYENLQKENIVEYLNNVTKFGFSENDLVTNYTNNRINYETKYKNYNVLNDVVNQWNIQKA